MPSASKIDREIALDIIATRVGADLCCIRRVERVIDEDDGVEAVYLCGELETHGGRVGYFSIPEHWPAGTTITWV